ncbi:MAG: SnoaL-like domain-containing protein [Pseudomonadota bacterium]
MANNDLLALDTELNTMIMNGEAMEAFEKFYAESVEMQENDMPPTVGKDANRAREIEFFGNVTELRGIKVLSNGAGGDTTFSQWHNDFTHKEWGEKTYTQVAVRTWKDGLIVKEVFYYGS